ncbi:MAG: hypothetical protein NC417_02795 [Candidatus Gastranaerophilales bacterium]|nr:hypothetical protein [Candidatus Gastranaerophilales bacterium]
MLIFVVIGVLITFWGSMVEREMQEQKRTLTTEHPVTLGAWIGYAGDGEFADGKDLTLQRVRQYYVTEQGKQAEYYEYERDGDTCRLCAYTIGRLDEQGNCVYQVSESAGGEEMVQEYFLYQYDADDRVVRQVTYREGDLVQIADFSYPDEEVTAIVIYEYQDGVWTPENSCGLLVDKDGRELLRIRLDTHEIVESGEPEEASVYRWYRCDQSDRIEYLLEVPKTEGDSSESGLTEACLARYEYYYEYNTKKYWNTEYLYRLQSDAQEEGWNLQDDTILLFDEIKLQRMWQGE